jgi:putative CocE/NonD family hydrolase
LPLNRRADVLSYSTAPLDAGAEITGRIRAFLWVSSDRLDTDFTARLIDVYPNGYALNLADGEIRARYRNGFDRPEMMSKGTAYEMVIYLGSTSNLFAAGHRIRLDISSSSYPKFEPNPNTGDSPGSNARPVIARNKIYHEPKKASYIELPLVRERAHSRN